MLKTVVLKAQHGVISLTRIVDITFEIGDGVQDKHIRFTGTTVDVNRALEELVYYPDPDFTTGVLRQKYDAIKTYVDDNGLILQGGNRTASSKYPFSM